MTLTRHARATAALFPLLLLGGCIGSVIGGGKPDALYRFGSSTAAPSAPGAAFARRSLLLMPVRFPAAAAGDRLLTVAGTDVAYIKDVRWVSAAPVLFRDGLAGTFQRRVPDIALADRVTASGVDAVLTVDVTRFEAAYDRGTAAAPTVHVAGVAVLIDPTSRTAIARRPFAQAQSASADTITAIVAATDTASRNALVELVDWTNASVIVRPPQIRSMSRSTKGGVGRRTEFAPERQKLISSGATQTAN